VALSWPIAVVFLFVLQIRMRMVALVLYALKDVDHVIIQRCVLLAQVVSIYGTANA